MTEDRLMRELGELAKDEPAHDRALPAELTRPFDDAELDAILDGARGKLGKRASASGEASNVASLAAKRWRWLAASVVAPLAAAAAFLVYAQRNADGPIPAYDLVVEGGEQSARGPAERPAEKMHLARDGRFTLVLRPRVPGTADVHARVLVEHEGALMPWNADVRISDEGAIRVDGRGALATLPSGASRVVVVVAGHAPTDGEVERALYGRIRGVEAFTQSIDVVP